MGRILRIELRRSAAVGIGLLLLAAGTGLLLTFPQGFVGRWLQLAMSGRTLLMVLWPLALAGGAWLGQRDARSRVGELFASTGRPRWQRVLPTAGALAVTVVSGYVLMLLIGSAWVAPTAGYFPVATIVVTAVGGLSLVAAGWLGMAVGRAIPRLVTPPALAVLGFAVVGLLPEWATQSYLIQDRQVPSALLLAPIFAGGLYDFETIVARVNMLQAVWLAALAATGFLLFGLARRRAVAVAVLPAVLGAVVTLPLLPGGGYGEAVAIDARAVELLCDDDGPQVCVTRVHAALLPEAVGPAREALAMMAAKLPNPPTRAVEFQQLTSSWTWGWSNLGPDQDRDRRRPPADTLAFPPFTVGPTGRAADLDDDAFLATLLEVVWWFDCDEASIRLDIHLAQVVAAAWLRGQPPAVQAWWEPEERATVDRSYQALVDLPQGEQERRMAAVREAGLDCRPEALQELLVEDVP